MSALVGDPTKDLPLGASMVTPYGWSSVTSGGYGRWVWCKYCRKNVRPLALIEMVLDERTSMCLCSVCRYGLTAPVAA